MRRFSLLLLPLCPLLACGGGADVSEMELQSLTEESAIVSSGNLAAASLLANKTQLAAVAGNAIADTSPQIAGLMATAAGRDVMATTVACAFASGSSVTLHDGAGNAYVYGGAVGLAPGWASAAPSAADRRWVSGCILARTTAFNVPVAISLRHDSKLQLGSTAPERATYSVSEGAFFGDLFGSIWSAYACSTPAAGAPAVNPLRVCTQSSNGSTTQCGFAYAGVCGALPGPCSDRTAPYGSCKGGAITYAEVVSSFVAP